ncbi:MAG: hypothetical protein P8Z37_15625, partial [Acidobacteriota bacterium]
MERKTPFLYTLFVLTLLMITPFNTANGQSHDIAIAIGKPVSVQINCSERAGGIEVYDATILIQEILRGAEAWELLQAADSSNKEPEEGYEYILARVSFKMKARGAPGDKTFDLGRPLQFTAFSENFEEYGTPSVKAPEPVLKGRTPADQQAEGWISMEVKKSDERPLLMFDPSSGGAWNRGKFDFFR